MKKLETYRQNVEGEMWAALAAIIAMLICAAGIGWALVFAVRWML